MARSKNQNPYPQFVADFARLYTAGQKFPGVSAKARKVPAPKPNAPVALNFSPHPDDECIVGGLARRLQRESGFKIINVAVTLGSKPTRRAARLKELNAACAFLGWGVEEIVSGGLEHITLAGRAQNPARWAELVRLTAALLWRHKPKLVFLPHAQDWHATHIGTHWLVMDALATLPAGFRCTLVETEFWGQMTAPNLLVESSPADVADLAAALAHHVGEVRRNPYHLRLPAWMMDNVRRGAELVGGSGGKAPNFILGTLYKISNWANRSGPKTPADSRILPAKVKAGKLLAS